MNKIFGLDLGTNSIGWALRNPDLTGNQFEKIGVLTFNKGVGLGKTGEYSYAAERTKKRSTRRLYQSRKYRLWATLEHLITEGYCPLTIDDLNKWRHFDKQEARLNNNGGRLYPTWNLAFDAWIKLDFNRDGLPDYSSPYQLRKELAEMKLDFTKEESCFKLGRALYHIAQRRGFKSSRKGADDIKEKDTDENVVIDLQYSEKKKNKVIADLFERHSEAKTIGWLFSLLENEKVRIRENISQHAIRENYKDEIKFIFHLQGFGFDSSLYKKLVETGKNKNDGSIFYKRPLRSQKGLIGKCTLEPNKYRAPISHPSFEKFRAWAFLNNIKYKENNEWSQLPHNLKQDIYNELFFRKSKVYFPFSEIVTFLGKKDKSKNWKLNYSAKTTVTACPVSARLKDIFGDDFLNIKIKKEQKSKSGKDFYDIEDVWHVLFNYEDQEYVSEFAESKLKLDFEKLKQFVIAWNACPVGYGMLSINAINKINVFLEKGLIYTEAVLLANIPNVLGKELWQKNEQLLLDCIGSLIDKNRQQKSILNIVNTLISKHKNLESTEKFGFKDKNYKLDDSDFKDIQNVIFDYFGSNKWADFIESEKNKISNSVIDCYQAYFAKQGVVRDHGSIKRLVTIQSNGENYYRTETGYYQLPKLIDTLKEFLKNNFEHLDDDKLSKIYHPSEINIYPPAKIDKDGIVKLGSPKTGSFKNPMAMRTLHELRKLLNYMIETSQIDNETRVVVEVARELNDANKRWAIEAWQRQRESENQEFAEAIKRLLQEDNTIKASFESNSDIDKLRLFYEQNEEQSLPPVIELEDDENGSKKKKKASAKDDVVRWNGYGKKLIEKYQLWKEQGYTCLYTGKLIRLTDLFDDNVIDFEHTLPRSKSFDNSLANITVCYHDYNRTVKKNKIPTELQNYDKDFDFGGVIGKCTAIKPRLEAWEERVKRIKQQIDFWKTKAKKASDKSWKDDAIRQRHLWQMELDYWQNKLDRFTITEITSGFKNSQKVDTQLISKYAFHYLKTYFDKVDVQKGSITADFRKIYQLQVADEKKDRSKHSHHAKDAAVLTLIPVAVKRDAILEKYYESKENRTRFLDTEPYKGFKRDYILSIDDNILINNITNNQELTPSKRKIRKRGKEVFIEGTKVNKWATGDSIRGQLHQDTFYGAIKPAMRGEKGNLLKDDNGKFIQEEKLRFVVRVPFNADFTGLEKIVDEGLKKQIRDHSKRVGSFKKAYEEGIYLLDRNGNPHGNRIRHIRVWASVSEPLPIKKQTNLSDKEYKQTYWAANATNSYFAIYKKDDKKYFDMRNLFETANFRSLHPVKRPRELFEDKVTIVKGKNISELPLTYVLESGLKVIFMEDSKEDLKLLGVNELNKRLYVFTNFEKDGRLNFKYHLEARNKIEEVYSESEIDFQNPKPTLRFGYSKYDFLVEDHDFKIRMDGTIKWLED